MDLRAWNLGVLVAISGLWLASGTQAEKPVLADGHNDAVRDLEHDHATHPADAQVTAKLGQAYLDARAPGQALSMIDGAKDSVRADPYVEHVAARALLDQGRSADALAMEHKVLDQCANPTAQTHCSTWLITSATRRADILNELVQLGVEDAQAHPEKSAIAYHNATREVGLTTR